MKRKKYSRAASFLLAVIVCFCALLPASATLAETTGSTVNNAVSTGLTVHFKKPADWSSEVRIHYWNLTPSSIPNSGSWPGILMTPEADGWYKQTVIGATGFSMVFNDSKGKQTGDLYRSGAEGWYKDGKWYDTNPDAPLIPAVTALPTPGEFSVRQTVVLKSTNTDDKIYYTTDGSIPTTASTLYTAPIIVSTTTTIKALGVNRNNQAGNVSSFTYTINPDLDTEKPSITASMPVGHSESSVNVYFTIKDNKSKSTTAYYTVDGTPATTSSPVYVSGDALAGLPGPEINISRTTTFNFLVVDGAGNKTTESFFYNIGPISANGDFREESIYFLLTARFYDGDSSNNRYCRSDDTSGNKANNDPPWRGDFKGLVEKLDYIKALGFSAIWISAPVLNRSDYDYHGYHAWDMEKIDGRLTSPGYDYQRLINECHARKIKLIQDIVLNHSGRYGINDKAEVKYWGDLNDPQWGNGTAIDYYDEYNPNFEYDGVSIEPKSGKSYYNGDLWQKEKPDLPWEGVEEKQWWPGGYGGTIPHAGELDRLWGVKSPYSSPEGYKIWHFQWPGMYESQFSLLNPEWYHCYWLKNWEDYTCQYGTIHEDCLDLNTESPVVQKYLTDAYSRYIQMGVDAFRVDTAKHISRNTFNRRFTPAFHKAAAAAGNPNFFMFAEVCVRDHGVWNKGNAALSVPFYTWKERTTYSADDKTAAWESYNYETSIMGADKQPVSNNHLLVGNEYHKPDYSQYSGMSVIDFRMHWNFRDASSAFSIRDGDKYTNDATWSVTYVDSHDYSPIEGGSNTYLRYNAGASAFAENWDLMFTWRGIPCIFYGNEILFKEGKVIDMGPNMPLEDTGRAYFGKHLEGTVETTDFGIWKNASGEISTTLTHPLAKHVTRLNRIRRAIPALQKGQYSTENVSGAIAFKKRFTDTDKKVDSFALVTISGDSTFSSIPNGTYVDSVTGDKKVVTNNTLTASCAGKGNMRIYVLNTANTPAPGKIGEDTQWLK